MYTSSDIRLEWPREGPFFKSDSNKHLRAKTRSFPRLSLKSGLLPLARYSNQQEIINRRLEQMYTPSDTGLEWLGEGPLYKSVSNKRQGSKLRLPF